MILNIKHDVYVKDLCAMIKPNYDFLSTNVRLFSNKKKRVLAEIDILAMKNGRVDVYEVKCGNRIIKAKKQLKRIRRLMPNVNDTFFFSGDSGELRKLEFK